MFVGNCDGLSQRKHAQNPGDNQQVLVSCSMTINTNGQHSLVKWKWEDELGLKTPFVPVEISFSNIYWAAGEGVVGEEEKVNQ